MDSRAAAQGVLPRSDWAAPQLVVEGRERPFRVLDVEGSEAIGAFYELALTFAPPEGGEDLPEVGDRASLEVSFGARTRTFHGIVRTFERGDTAGELPVHRAVLVPAAYVLSLREDCRIFQGRRAPEIIEAVLQAAGFTTRDYRLALARDYAVREHTTQYRESDWSFLRRLLQAEGMYAFLEHAGDHDALVFADMPSSHVRMSEPDTLTYRAGAGALEGGERIERFRHVEELRARSVVLRGHALRTPHAPFSGRAEQDGPAPAIYDAPVELDAPDRADALARQRLEAERASSAVASATSDCLAVQPGVVFTLRGHDASELDRDWLVTSVEHRLRSPAPGDASGAGGHYENRFTAMPAAVPYRDRARAPRPAIGIQTALVVGPAGQEVHCDDLGRVKVQFRWDREGRSDDRSSAWLRVSQAWAGAGHGALFVPRVGNEVLVDFVDGDADRPIVVGSVYDGVNAPPLALPESRTSAIIRATSTDDRRGHSELRFDAEKGREYVLLGSRRDLGVRVGQDKTETIAQHELLQVGGDREQNVRGCETVSVGGDRALGVGGTHAVTVGGVESRTIGAAEIVEVGADRSINVGGKSTEIVGEHLSLRVGGDKAESVKGDSRETVEGARELRASAIAVRAEHDLATTAGASQTSHADKTHRTSAGEIVEVICGEATITAHKDGTVTLIGKNVRLKVEGPVEIDGDSLTVKSRGPVNLHASGAVKVRGRGVNLN
jgi:type VI secretion system secreted protein VgrG